MNHKNFSRILLTGLTTLTLPQTQSQAVDVKVSSKRSNVLFISIDDLNDWIGCLGGHPDAKTPNMDRLAARGMLFMNAHCSAPVCNPSRTSLLSGLRPSTSGVYNNLQTFREALPDTTTLPKYFKDNGYSVKGCGKIFHSDYDKASWHDYLPRGYDQGKPEQTIDMGGEFQWGPIAGGDEMLDDHRLINWAVEQLKSKQQEPFFLAVGMMKPHLPWFAPQKYFDMYPLDKVTLPVVNPNDLDDVPKIAREIAAPDWDHKHVTEADEWRSAVQAYLACISFFDAQIGLLIDALDKSPYAKNTIICLWSDHGWHLGEKLHWRKFALWEEATHNVLMMVDPQQIEAGTRCSRPVSLLDIYPTLIALCGLPPKPDLDGQSFLPLLKNPQAEWNKPVVTTHERNNHSVRSEHWRYIRYQDGTEELYNHQTDPFEWTNLASNAEFEPVKQDLARWLPTNNAPNAPMKNGQSTFRWTTKFPSIE